MADEDPTDSFDLSNPNKVRVGVTRGEYDLEIGSTDYPDRADVSVRPEGDAVVLTVDAMVADHVRGHADVEMTAEEARKLRDVLDETVRWMTED